MSKLNIPLPTNTAAAQAAGDTSTESLDIAAALDSAEAGADAAASAAPAAGSPAAAIKSNINSSTNPAGTSPALVQANLIVPDGANAIPVSIMNWALAEAQTLGTQLLGDALDPTTVSMIAKCLQRLAWSGFSTIGNPPQQLLDQATSERKLALSELKDLGVTAEAQVEAKLKQGVAKLAVQAADFILAGAKVAAPAILAAI